MLTIENKCVKTCLLGCGYVVVLEEEGQRPQWQCEIYVSARNVNRSYTYDALFFSKSITGFRRFFIPQKFNRTGSLKYDPYTRLGCMLSKSPTIAE